jgi:hypothetical protein
MASCYNTMHDAQLGDFKASDERDASDPRWWNGAEPIWVTAERAGVHAATMFWPGSQAPIRGVRPTHWRSYDATVSNDARVDEVVSWLAQPTPRIRFATLYFELLDKTGHAYGPDSPEMQHDIVAIDARHRPPGACVGRARIARHQHRDRLRPRHGGGGAGPCRGDRGHGGLREVSMSSRPGR